MPQSPAPDPVNDAPSAVPGEGTTSVGNPLVEVVEIDGRGGLDPTRYGDWEKNGRCIDF